jgi:tetratricopeptide (TPR) repeat protein
MPRRAWVGRHSPHHDLSTPTMTIVSQANRTEPHDSTHATGADEYFGRRLRETRQRAGLSQSDLATDGVSSSYVSLLESGKRQPTRATALALAKRLRVSVDFLLSGFSAGERHKLDLELKYAELALRNGEGADALTRANAVLESQPVPPEMLTRARELRAEALEATGNLEEAAKTLDALHAEALAAQRFQAALRLTIPLARCYKELGDLRFALTLTSEGLARSAELELTGSDVHAELAAMTIGLHYLLGDHARADLIAEEILSGIERSGSRRGRGSIYWNASLNAQARGDIAKALALAESALGLFAEDDDVRGTARLRNAYAWLLLRTTPPRPEQARDLLERSLAALREAGTAVDQAYAETELGRAFLLLGEPTKALRCATSAARKVDREPRHQLAHAQLVIARALLELGRREEAIASYREAAAALTRLGVGRQAAEAWRELGDAFTSLHQHKEAAEAYRSALHEAGVQPAPEPVASAGTKKPAQRKSRRVATSRSRETVPAR